MIRLTTVLIAVGQTTQAYGDPSKNGHPRPAFQGYSRSSKVTRINRVHDFLQKANHIPRPQKNKPNGFFTVTLKVSIRNHSNLAQLNDQRLTVCQ